MTGVFSDGSGFHYLGDCRWANHDLNYPNTDFLLAHPHTDISNGITNLCTNSGLLFRTVASQTLFNGTTVFSALNFGGKSDTINDRYSFHFARSGSGTATTTMLMFNDNGNSRTDNQTQDIIGQNNLIHTIGVTSLNFLTSSFTALDAQINYINWAGVSDGDFLALAVFGTNTSRVLGNQFTIYYAGLLDNVNNNFNYYSQNNIYKSIILTRGRESVSSPIGIGHYTNQRRLCLSSGKAEYAFICSDGQNPQTTWLSDMYVFDSNTNIGQPAIGRVRGLLFGTGSFTIGKPVKITGTVVPDSGSRWYLPVGNFAGKTVLMKCYSSVDL